VLETQFTYQKYTYIGLWRIAETEQNLWQQYQPNASEVAELNAYKLAARRQEWLASRLAVRQILPQLSPHSHIHISKDEYNKPFFSSELGCTLSLSHGKGWAAAAINTQSKPLGIDIEPVSPKILRIQDRFLSQKEVILLHNFAQNQNLETTLVLTWAWCAKEAIYKMHGTKGLNFITDIKILGIITLADGFFAMQVKLLQSTDIQAIATKIYGVPMAWCV
jgi:phosphopantetheinyl transferase